MRVAVRGPIGAHAFAIVAASTHLPGVPLAHPEQRFRPAGDDLLGLELGRLATIVAAVELLPIR